MKKNSMSTLVIIIIFALGMISGVLLDKDWLSEEQQHYIKSLQTENKMLMAERNTWLSYVQDEIRDYDIFITAEEDSTYLASLLNQVGVEVKVLEEMGVLENEGILISLGQEVDLEENMKLLALDTLPYTAIDIQRFYLSLLRLKGDT